MEVRIGTYLMKFLKEQVGIGITFFISTVLIITFYTLEMGYAVELVYPISLAGSCYFIYFVVKFYQYIRFHKALEQMKLYQDLNIELPTFTEQKVQSAFYEVHNRYTDEAQRKLLQEREDKRFLSSWIHAMKTPVSVSYLLIQRFKKKEIEEAVFLKQIDEERKKLEEQLDIVLNMLRLKEFVKDYEPAVINLHEELNQLINKHKSLFIQNKVFPKVEQVEKPVLILSDRKWNDMLLLQVISNAVKYSTIYEKERDQYIYFRILRENGKITLVIRDEGIGIPSYDLPRVYEPFFTGRNGRKTEKASGIGLYFCKEVCKLLGHELTIESTQGEGTTVMISYLSKV